MSKAIAAPSYTSANLNINNRFNDFKRVDTQIGHEKEFRAARQSEKSNTQNNEATSISKPKKALILTSSLLGTLASLVCIGKMQKLNIFKWSQFKKLNCEAKEILILSVGSLLGGLTSGLIVDSTNKKDKLRESLQQFIGNIAFPISFVGGANMLWKGVKEHVKLPKLKETSGMARGLTSFLNIFSKFTKLGKIKASSSAKFLNAMINAAPPVAATFLGLGAGILLGNKVANSMNNKIFKENQERKVKVSDLAAHVDDTLIGASLVAQNVASNAAAVSTAAPAGAAAAVSSLASRLIPPALVVPGYMTGTAQ